MSDFPETLGQPPFSSFGSIDSNSPLSLYLAVAGLSASASTYVGANTAIYCGVSLDRPMLAQKMGVFVGVQSGNLDVGIYDERGNRLVSAGSTAVGVAGLQIVDITDTWLPPGTYFVAMCCDNTTATFNHVATTVNGFGRVCGFQQQAVGAVTLPATATFAAYNQTKVPVVSVQCASVL